MTIVEKKVIDSQENVKPLEGKVAIVTGGSRGIGAEIARELAKNGAKVAINYQSNVDSANKIVDEIEKLGGVSAAIQCDVANSEDATRLIEETIEHFGKVDILVNNAGITRDRTFRRMSAEEWNEVIDVNLNSIFHTTNAAINHMLEQKFGRIINISSIIGQAGGFGQTNYSASKAGMLGFTKSLALETARNGITVNAVCPGFIATEMVAAMPENVLENMISKIPMQRLGQTEEIAEAVLYLTQAKYVTGQAINVNGGLYM